MMLFRVLFFGALIAVPVLQWRLLRRWSGIWRALSLLPLAIVAWQIAIIVRDTNRDPTSHNLWPFEVVLSAFAALVCFGGLALARQVAMFVHRRRQL
jgi:hypothetical protein